MELRKTFHEELRELKDEVMKMGHLVEEAINKAVEALVKGDASLAEEVVKGDDAIDNGIIRIEEQGMSIQARQSPVAKDLRLIYSIQFIASHLERMGDLALNIAKLVEHTAGEKRVKSLLELLSEMGEKVSKVVSASLEAFDKKDVELAKKLPEMDEPIDGLFKQFLKELTLSCADENTFDWATTMMLASRYLERIADHAVDIGERVCFLVTGEMIELD